MKKKFVALVLFSLICLTAIGFVSAADNSLSDMGDSNLEKSTEESNLQISTDESNLELSLCEDPTIENTKDSSIASSISERLSDGEKGNFTELMYLISDSDKSVSLEKDYIRLPEDNVAKTGVILNHPGFVVEGNGHTIDANNLGRIFNMEGVNVVVKNLILINGNYSDGGAVGGLTLTGTESSHAICFTFINCTFANNTAERGGAIFSNGSGSSYNEYRLINCTFENNTAENGGAVHTFAWWANITNTTFKDNQAEDRGGAVVLDGGNTDFNNVTFINNTADRGGAVGYENAAFFHSKNSNYYNNTAKSGSGGAMFLDDLVVSINNDEYIGNDAKESGGAVYLCNFSSINVNGTNFVNNSCHHQAHEYSSESREGGGAICASTSGFGGSIDNSTFINNSAENYGGAMALSGTSSGVTYNVRNCSIDNNTANRFGGVVIFTRSSTVDECNFTNNHANEVAGALGMFNYYDTIQNSNFENNSAGTYAGAVISFAPYYHMNTIDNVTFVNNSAGTYGGALVAISTDVSNSNFTDNEAGTYGGALTAYGSSVQDSNFDNNDAPDGTVLVMNDGSDINRASSSQSNNGLSDDEVSTDYTDRGILSPMSGYPPNVIWSDLGYIGFCCEKFYSQPYSGEVDHELSVIENNIDGTPVGEYLKIMMFTYFNKTDDIYNLPFPEYVWEFTDYDFRNSNLTIVKDVIRLYDEGMRVPNQNALKVLDDGSILRMDFLALDTPDGEQDIFLFNWDKIGGDIKKESLNKTTFIGEKIEFRINVTNTGAAKLSDVTVCDDEYSKELVFLNWTAEEGNWTYDGKAWTLLDNLTRGASASIILTFKSLTNGTFYNNATLKTKNFTLDNDSADTNVYTPQLFVKKITINKTVYNGKAEFIIQLNNTGDYSLNDVFVEDIADEGLVYAGYENGSREFIYKDGKFCLNGTLAPNEIATFTVKFNVTKTGNFTNRATGGSNETENHTWEDTVESFSPSMKVEKKAEDTVVYEGNRTSFIITVSNTGDCDLNNVTVEEYYPEELIYHSFVDDSGKWDKDGAKWTYSGTLAPGESSSFKIFFDVEKAGNYTNVVVGSSDKTTKTYASDNITVIENETDDGGDSDDNSTDDGTDDSDGDSDDDTDDSTDDNTDDNTDDEETPEDSDESEDGDKSKIPKSDKVHHGGINAGNPLFALILVLGILGLSPLRRKK